MFWLVVPIKTKPKLVSLLMAVVQMKAHTFCLNHLDKGFSKEYTED